MARSLFRMTCWLHSSRGSGLKYRGTWLPPRAPSAFFAIRCVTAGLATGCLWSRRSATVCCWRYCKSPISTPPTKMGTLCWSAAVRPAAPMSRSSRTRRGPVASPGSIAMPRARRLDARTTRQTLTTPARAPGTRARGSDELFWTGVYIFFTQRAPGITVSARYRGAQGPLRLFGVDITLDALSHFLASVKVGRSGRAVIIDDTGQLIAAPGGLTMVRQVDGEPAAPRIDEIGDDVLTHAYDRFRIEGTGHRVIEVGGRSYVSAVTPITGAGRDWLTLIVVPEKDFVGFVASSNRRALWMSVAIVAVAALLASLLVRQGLRADRNARQLLERQSALTRQSNAFASLASDASLFDPASALPSRTLTETLAEVTGARRASIWRLADRGGILRCEDSFDRETAGHSDGLELHHGELPALFASLSTGEEIEVADVARDRRTAELGIVLNALGTKSLLSMTVRRDDRIVGAIWLEGAPVTSGNRDFVRAVGNMVAVRLAGAPATAAMRERVTAPDRPTAPLQRAPHNFAADLRSAVIDPPAAHAETYTAVAVMVLRFTDATAVAGRLSGEPRSIFDEIARGLQLIAADNGVPYLKLAGHEVIAAAGFGPAEQAAATAIADTALAVRDRCIALFD